MAGGKAGRFLSVLLRGTSPVGKAAFVTSGKLFATKHSQPSPREMETLEGRTKGMTAEWSIVLGEWGFLSQHQFVSAVNW